MKAGEPQDSDYGKIVIDINSEKQKGKKLLVGKKRSAIDA